MFLQVKPVNDERDGKRDPGHVMMSSPGHLILRVSAVMCRAAYLRRCNNSYMLAREIVKRFQGPLFLVEDQDPCEPQFPTHAHRACPLLPQPCGKDRNPGPMESSDQKLGLRVFLGTVQSRTVTHIVNLASPTPYTSSRTTAIEQVNVVA
jgi:hypothetical protein